MYYIYKMLLRERQVQDPNCQAKVLIDRGQIILARDMFQRKQIPAEAFMHIHRMKWFKTNELLNAHIHALVALRSELTFYILRSK